MDTNVVDGHECCGWIRMLLMDTNVVDGYECCGWTRMLWMDTNVVRHDILISLYFWTPGEGQSSKSKLFLNETVLSVSTR